MAENQAYKILLVDDEKSFCEVISFALEKSGFNIECFSDPKEALLKVIESKPDIILLDIAMPEMNGLEFLVHLKKDLGIKCPPVIILTNLKYTDDGQEINENFIKSIGAAGIIHKSSDLESIIQKINEVITYQKNNL
ncbi:MAG: hypothetical protein KatS3mg095_0862 [Candidatus Parcubacteria bacterium]|nr:MAG: hypothetical protein KatS3mg095_0862 [Candidatus Parcubacteria bacterium]